MPAIAQQQEQPCDADVRQALGRVLGSLEFRGSPRLQAFLHYIVERALAGECARIKGYTVAVEALGRPAEFDPRIDPIVRVEAGRLRRRLALYYAGEGANDPVKIALASGSYVPRFHGSSAPRAREAAAPSPGGDGTAGLAVTFRHLIGLCRLQIETISAEVALAERLIEQALGANGAACGTAARLLPTAPSSSDAATAAQKPAHERQVEQAQGAPAARPRRPRAA